jgi:sugar phosphate isomerase/epimerase
MTLRFAYSTINWTTTCDMAAALAEIRDTGWHAVELFNHELDWLGTPDHLRELLNGLQVPVLFGSISVPTRRDEIEIHKRRIDYAALFGATQ